MDGQYMYYYYERYMNQADRSHSGQSAYLSELCRWIFLRKGETMFEWTKRTV